MKKLLRLIFKIVFTPILLIFLFTMFMCNLIIIATAWLFDDYTSAKIAKELMAEDVKTLKKWFITI